jgi:sugar phosphate isomerase/epimerase
MGRTYDIPGRPASSPLAGWLPFRLGATSYVIPDDILPNVRHLAGTVDDIELILFESDEMSNMPDAATLGELAEIATASGMTYTVHLPLDADLGRADDAARARDVGKCTRVVELTRHISPFAWVVHLHGEKRGDVPAEDNDAWRTRVRSSLSSLVDVAGDARRLCVETLDYPFALVADIVREAGASVCLDIGHLLVNGRDVSRHLDDYLEDTRVVHLHGVDEGHDHRGAEHLDTALLSELCRRFAGRSVDELVVTLEVFSADHLASSVEALRKEFA